LGLLELLHTKQFLIILPSRKTCKYLLGLRKFILSAKWSDLPLVGGTTATQATLNYVQAKRLVRRILIARSTLQPKKPAREAFEWLKQAITTAPGLAVPDVDAPFVVAADASGFGNGADLMQNDPSGPGNSRRPLAYHSARFSDAERNYAIGERE
jgi:hypothetical protein